MCLKSTAEYSYIVLVSELIKELIMQRKTVLGMSLL